MSSWMSAPEIAAANLPNVPHTKKAVLALAAREDWLSRRDRNGRPLWRERAGRGGGKEWHTSLLPGLAQVKLVGGALPHATFAEAAAGQAEEPDSDTLDGDLMDAFARLPAKTRKIAAQRLAVIDHVERLEATVGKANAVNTAARDGGVGFSTVYNWLKLIEGRARLVRIALLAPKPKGHAPKAEIEPEAWKWFISYYLRPGPITFEEAAYQTNKFGTSKGWAPLPYTKTVIRRFNATVPRHVAVLRKHGPEGLARLTPALERTRAHFVAGQAVVADGHRWDIAIWDEDGNETRLQTLAIQDLYSGKLLAWRHSLTESSHIVQLAFHDLFANVGVPEEVYLDNGMGFCSKMISGGCQWRYRGKVKHDELKGVLPQFGCRVHFARPAHGQAKPIERTFKDLATRVPTMPAFDGAYLGNRPTEKPFNYGTKRIPVADLIAIIDRELHDHNARLGRRSEVCGGVMSFDQAFAKSYETAIVYRPSGAQLAPFLMQAAEHMVRPDGTIHLFGSRYHNETLHDWARQRVLVRFDPDDLTKPVLIQTRDGAFICDAPALGKVAFDDAAGARRQYALIKKRLELTKAAVLAGLLTPAEQAEEMARYQESLAYGDDDDLDDAPEPAAVSLGPRGRSRSSAAVALAHTPNEIDAYYEAEVEALLRGPGGLRLVSSTDDPA
jgi:putative transposase